MSYLGSTPTTQNFIAGTDQFTGNGSTTNWTLSRFVNSTNDIEVVIANVVQNPTSYSVSGNTLTISPAVTNAVVFYVRYLTTTLQSVGVSDGAITTPKLADSAVTVSKLSATGTPSATTYFRGDGTWATIISSPIPNISTAINPTTVTNSTGTPMVNTGSGTFTFTVPAGCTAVRITATGGGGSGQTGPGGGLGGNGGGAAGTVIKRQAVTPGQVLTITVGAGGTGSLGSGGNTTVVNATLGLSVTAGGAAGQSGGTATGGDLNMLGATAGYGFEGNTASLVNGRDGANSFWGGAGGGASLGASYGNSGQGFPARGYGSGGGGGSPGNAGGTGMTGIVYIEY